VIGFAILGEVAVSDNRTAKLESIFVRRWQKKDHGQWIGAKKNRSAAAEIEPGR
jgi:hypothetical protein